MRVLLALFFLSSGASSFACAGTLATNDARARDLMQTLQARQRLHDDPDLAHLNIGVSVHNRVATLFGPAPSAEAIFRAELCLRGMIGLAEVRNEMFVSDLLEPVRPPVKLKSPKLNPPEVAPPMLPRLPPSAPSRASIWYEPAPSGKKPPGAQQASQPKAPPAALPVPRLGTPEMAPAKGSGAAVKPDDALASAVRVLLQSKSAYRALEFRVEGRLVFLNAPEASSAALSEAARAIAQLPGVDGVILGDLPQQR